MGLLDSVLGSVLRGGGQMRGADPKMALIMAVLSMMMNRGAGASQGAGQGGGLGSILGGMLGGGSQSGAGGGMGDILGGMLGGGRAAGGGGGLGDILGGMLGGGRANAMPDTGLEGALGGLGGIQDIFKRAGMGQQVDSWVSSGDNLPISAEQIRQVLGGSGHLGQLAQAAGMSEDEAANDLTDILPDLVNQLTPQGGIPAGGADIEALLRKMMG